MLNLSTYRTDWIDAYQECLPKPISVNCQPFVPIEAIFIFVIPGAQRLFRKGPGKRKSGRFSASTFCFFKKIVVKKKASFYAGSGNIRDIDFSITRYALSSECEFHCATCSHWEFTSSSKALHSISSRANRIHGWEVRPWILFRPH